MIERLKWILGSKVFRLIFSAILVFLAFRKVNVLSLLGQLSQVPLWFVIFYLIYAFFTYFIGSYRWCLLLIKKPKWKDVFNFTKSTYLGNFYSLFFPSGLVGDLLKWMPLEKKYPDLSKTKLLSSVLLDRVIGFTAYIFVAFVAAIIGRVIGFSFPDYLMWLFGGLFLGVLIFYSVVFTVDIERFLKKMPIINKLAHIAELLKGENKKRLMWCLVVAFITEIAWITPVWLISLVFNTGFSLLSVYVFMPIIGLILVLPISVAGFGAREHLFIYFFSTLGIGDEKILLVSTFMGIIGVLNMLLGGLVLLF